MKPCPNCSAPVEASARLCPNCGAVVPTFRTPAETATALPPKLLTGRAWADFLTGAAVQYLLHLGITRLFFAAAVRRLYAAPPGELDVFFNQLGQALVLTAQEMLAAIAVGALTYFTARRFYPVVARGLGYTTLALLAVILGAFLACHPLKY